MLWCCNGSLRFPWCCHRPTRSRSNVCLQKLSIVDILIEHTNCCCWNMPKSPGHVPVRLSCEKPTIQSLSSAVAPMVLFEQTMVPWMLTPSATRMLSIRTELVILTPAPIWQLRPITERLTRALSPSVVASPRKLSVPIWRNGVFCIHSVPSLRQQEFYLNLLDSSRICSLTRSSCSWSTGSAWSWTRQIDHGNCYWSILIFSSNSSLILTILLASAYTGKLLALRQTPSNWMKA